MFRPGPIYLGPIYPTASGAFGVYASVIDNVTNDPRTLLPSYSNQLIPSSAHAPGAGGAFYTTGLALFNLSPIETRVTLQFLGHDTDGHAGPVRRFSLPPGGSLAYADMRPGFPRHISGVREDAAFRTNLILTNSSEIAVDVDVTLWGSAGHLLGTTRVSLPALGMTQLARVVQALGISTAVVDARLTISTPTPTAALAVYASVIDNITNDPRTLLPLTGALER